MFLGPSAVRFPNAGIRQSLPSPLQQRDGRNAATLIFLGSFSFSFLLLLFNCSVTFSGLSQAAYPIVSSVRWVASEDLKGSERRCRCLFYLI